MFANRLLDEYENGVKKFIKLAVDHAENPDKIICPCLSCCYSRRINVAELKDHLVCYGIDQSYTCWTRHDTYEGDRINDIANAVEEDLQDCPEMFERLGSPLLSSMFPATGFEPNYRPGKRLGALLLSNNMVFSLGNLEPVISLNQAIAFLLSLQNASRNGAEFCFRSTNSVAQTLWSQPFRNEINLHSL
ncbi:hypothetical protein VNO77_07526 [Canavalia gladiata]|uniref:Transposase-associated domain-containing protein n=1 Tax=Canavalia gladiata TaxID=3824 RepID=A0AAN9M8I7_CANGL